MPPPPGSVAQAPAGDLQSDVRSDVRSAVRSVVPGNPPPPPADPKACNGYTVLMQIYGAQPRPVVDEFRAAWLDELDIQFQTGCCGFNERLGIPGVSALGDHLIVKHRGTLPREFDSVHGSIP